jgi:hypothetical protein
MNNCDEVTRLDLAALAHQLRLEMASTRTRLDDLLAAHRASASEVWDTVRELSRRVGQLEGKR